MSVAGLEVDVVKYAGRKDFQVYTVYKDARSYTVVVRRLDDTGGWTENIRVLAYLPSNEYTETIVIGPSDGNMKSVDKTVEFDLTQGPPVIPLPHYEPFPTHPVQRISRSSFNKLFDTDIIQLPTSLFAVGVKNGLVYIYNETYEQLYMIDLSIRHIVGTFIADKIYSSCYFIICATDGFLEGHYVQGKNGEVPGESCISSGNNQLVLKDPSKFPVLYKDRFVLAQSHQITTPNAICVPDRYYFCMNRYNEYRSIHGGIPFNTKKPQIVFAARPRGSKYNFTKRRDIEMNQREYFSSDAVPKTNIVAPKWIERSEMVKYKYILDIDGHGSTWDATAWKLNSGSVILKTDSCWKQWFYDKYKAWEHYVPVADDFSDIQDRFAWCESHPVECINMIKRCRELFQEIYRYHNVLNSTRDAINTLTKLTPAYTEPSTGRSIYMFSTSESNTPCKVNKITSPSSDILVISRAICNTVKPDDIVIHLNMTLMDFNGYDPVKILKTYDAMGKSIVYAAERNLWPDILEPKRFKLEQLAPDSLAKYPNMGFFMARASEFKRVFDEQIYEPQPFTGLYISNVYLTGRYSMTLDYGSNLVLNTFRCSREEIEDAKKRGVPFIHYNAGR